MKRRMTEQRMAIFQAVKHTQGHPSAEDIYRRLKPEYPQLSLGTVYRNLSLLADQKQIGKISNFITSDRFDKSPIHHDHMVCEMCGAVHDVNVPYTVNTPVLADGHQIEACEVIFKGVCKDCLAAKADDQHSNII